MAFPASALSPSVATDWWSVAPRSFGATFPQLTVPLGSGLSSWHSSHVATTALGKEGDTAGCTSLTSFVIMAVLQGPPGPGLAC
jgi:hypothetical protein